MQSDFLVGCMATIGDGISRLLAQDRPKDRSEAGAIVNRPRCFDDSVVGVPPCNPRPVTISGGQIWTASLTLSGDSRSLRHMVGSPQSHSPSTLRKTGTSSRCLLRISGSIFWSGSPSTMRSSPTAHEFGTPIFGMATQSPGDETVLAVASSESARRRRAKRFMRR